MAKPPTKTGSTDASTGLSPTSVLTGSKITPTSRFQAKFENMYNRVLIEAEKLAGSSQNLTERQKVYKRELDKLTSLTEQYSKGIKDASGQKTQIALSGPAKQGISNLKDLGAFIESIVKTSGSVQKSLTKLQGAKSSKTFITAYENLSKSLDTAKKFTDKWKPPVVPPFSHVLKGSMAYGGQPYKSLTEAIKEAEVALGDRGVAYKAMAKPPVDFANFQPAKFQWPVPTEINRELAIKESLRPRTSERFGGPERTQSEIDKEESRIERENNRSRLESRRLMEESTLRRIKNPFISEAIPWTMPPSRVAEPPHPKYLTGVTGMANPEAYMMHPGVTGMGNPYVGGFPPGYFDQPDEPASSSGISMGGMGARALGIAKMGYKGWKWANNQAKFVAPEYERIIRAARNVGVPQGAMAVGPFEESFGQAGEVGRLGMAPELGTLGVKSIGDIADIMSDYGTPFHAPKAMAAALKAANMPLLGMGLGTASASDLYAPMFGQMMGMAMPGVTGGSFDKTVEMFSMGVQRGMEHFLPPRVAIDAFQKFLTQSDRLGIVTDPQKLMGQSLFGANFLNPSIRSGQAGLGARAAWQQIGAQPFSNPMMFQMMMLDYYNKTGKLTGTGDEFQDWLDSMGAGKVLSKKGKGAITGAGGLSVPLGMMMAFGAGGAEPMGLGKVYNDFLARSHIDPALGVALAPNPDIGKMYAAHAGLLAPAPKATKADMSPTDEFDASMKSLTKYSDSLKGFLAYGPEDARKATATYKALQLEGANATMNLTGKVIININSTGTEIISKGEDVYNNAYNSASGVFDWLKGLFSKIPGGTMSPGAFGGPPAFIPDKTGTSP